MKVYLALSLVLMILVSGCTQTQESPQVESKVDALEDKLEDIEETVDELEDKVEELEVEVEEMKNGKNETIEIMVEEDDENLHTFEVKIQNVHETMVLSPGVFVAHKPPFSIDYINKLAPSEFEPLAEYGNNSAFYDYVVLQEGVVSTYSIDTLLAPGESTTFTLKVPRDKPRETYLSGAMMLVQTNDGFASVNNIALFTSGNGPKNSTTNAQNYDAGVEENSAVGSGFEGGQPDPSKGSENVDNGTETSPQRPVSPHPQVSKTVMKVTVTPKSY
jgi:TolA-binding protein